MEYRKKIDLDKEREYWFVQMGEYDRLNGPAAYPFPTEEAARKFAVNHKRMSLGQREIFIQFPNGTMEEVTDD